VAPRRPRPAAPRVRPARLGDLEAMAALLGHLFSQESEFRPEPALQRRGLRQILRRPGQGRLLVVEAGGEVLGMVSLLAGISTALGSKVAWLEDLVVAPGHRGQGLGRRLLLAALAEARRRGWRRVSLLTDADNARAQALYRSEGFKPSPMRTMRRLIER